MRDHRILAVVAAGIGGTAMFRAYTAILVVDPSGGTPYTTLQSAINAAVPGQDEVFARCGFYHERVTMRSGVNLRGSGPQCTTIDGTGFNQPAVEMPGSTLLEGFTVRKGGQGGISVSGTSTIIRGNVIEDSNLSGIIAWGGSPVITRNIIRNNHNDEFGGGIWRVGTSAVISANLIVGNMSIYGGGIYVGGGGATIANNTIVGNSAVNGGGIFVATAVTPSLVTVANNVVVGNGGPFASGGGVYATQSANVAFTANDVYQNDPDNYFITSGPDPTGTNGNVSVDPLFVDTIVTSFAGFQPRSDSPLVDNGSSASAPAQDLRGVPIPVDGNADGTSRVDIGARENEGLTRLRTDAAGFIWDVGTHQPSLYGVYRGDLYALRQTGTYTQDPAVVPGAEQFCGLPTNQLADADEPLPGQVRFYLVAARGAVHGTLGFSSAAQERATTLPCPP